MTSPLTNSHDFDIRYSEEEDTKTLEELLSLPEMEHFSPPSDDEERALFLRVWTSFFRYRASLTATFKGEPIGFFLLLLMPFRKVAHHCLCQFIVDPKYQRKGVGTALVRNGKHLAKSYFRLEGIHAEILDVTPAVTLLKQGGFIQTVRQERYIKEGDKEYPRILMECRL